MYLYEIVWPGGRGKKIEKQSFALGKIQCLLELKKSVDAPDITTSLVQGNLLHSNDKPKKDLDT